MKKKSEKFSFTWLETKSYSTDFSFDKNTYDCSYIWRTYYIKKLIFLTVSVWKKLSQRQIVAGLGSPKNTSSLSSISSTLEAGKRQNFYIKEGMKQDAKFSLSENYSRSKQMIEFFYFPSSQAIFTVKKRANNK